MTKLFLQFNACGVYLLPAGFRIQVKLLLFSFVDLMVLWWCFIQDFRLSISILQKQFLHSHIGVNFLR